MTIFKMSSTEINQSNTVEVNQPNTVEVNQPNTVEVDQENTVEYWKNLSKSSVNLSEVEVDLLADKFLNKLLQDEKTQALSVCAIGTPRLNGSIDRKSKLGHKIAFKLLNITEAEAGKKITAYIEYTQMLAKLRRKYDEQQKIAEEEKNRKSWELDDYKKARATGQYCLWHKLKTKENIPEQVLNPTPMPVEVAPLDELQPFLKFLATNGTEESEVKERNDDFIQFTRGTFFSDGRMDLCKQVVGPNWIENLMESIKNNTNIKHFLLGNNIIDTVGGKAIGDFIHLQNNDAIKAKIETWYIAGNRINPDGIKEIADALSKDKYANALWLKRNPILPLGGLHLSNMLLTNNFLKVLDLQNTGLLDEGVKNLTIGLKVNDTLRHLYLDANGITIDGAKYLADYFNHVNENNKTGITSLWMEMNRLGDDGTTILAESLRKNKTIKKIIAGVK